MARKEGGNGPKVFIDPTVLALVDESKPSYLSRTGWVNHLIQVGLAANANLTQPND